MAAANRMGAILTRSRPLLLLGNTSSSSSSSSLRPRHFQPLQAPVGVQSQSTEPQRGTARLGAQSLFTRSFCCSSSSSSSPPEEPTNCCGSGCDPCVWEVYHDELKEYQEDLDQPEQNPVMAEALLASRAPGEEFALGDRAMVRNFRGKKLQHLNGLRVEVVNKFVFGKMPVRWTVRPIGGQRTLTVGSDKLQLLWSETAEEEGAAMGLGAAAPA